MRSQRGVDGGYWLARPAEEITVAEVDPGGGRPDRERARRRPRAGRVRGLGGTLRDVWIAVRANLRAVLEQVTIADLARGELPVSIEELAADPDAWQPH